MRQLNIPLSENQSFNVYESGEYIRILDAPGGAVLVECSQPAIFAQLQEGQSIRVGVPFPSLRITNGATPQTVVVIIGTGEFSDNTFSGDVTISGVSAVNVQNTPTVQTIIDAVKTYQEPMQIASAYVILTGAFVQVLAPRVGRKRLRFSSEISDCFFSFDGGTTSIPLPNAVALDLDGYAGAIWAKNRAASAGASIIEGY